MAGYNKKRSILVDYEKAHKKIIDDALKIKKEKCIQHLDIAVAHETFEDAVGASGKKVNWGAMFYGIS